MTLTPSQIEHYRREGYVVLDSFFNEARVRDVDQLVQRITDEAITSGKTEGVMELEPERDGAAPRPRRILNPFEVDEGFRRIATDERLLDCLQCLIGPDININLSKLNFKPARVGSVVEWHQDLAYYPHTNDDLATLLVYIDEATEENGCLQVLPRQHDHYFKHDLPDGRFAGMITETIDDGRYGQVVSLAAPAGSVIMMHPITPHSSQPNRSDHPRRTLIFGYRASDAIPIWHVRAGDMEENTHQLRGQPARFARFGGPAPYLAQFDESESHKSLYTLQDEAKEISRTQSGQPAPPR